jgi:predicted porin
MKKMLPLIALLGLAGAAQAQVTLYGLVDLSYGKNNIGFPNQKEAFYSGGDNGSSQGNSTTRVGIKGSTDVGSGVKAKFNFETAGITIDGQIPGPRLFNRQAWAGFEGSFGEVRAGRQDSVAFQTMIDYDFNGAANAASAGANTGVGAFMGHLGRNNGVQYISPNFGGFTVQAGYVNQTDDVTTGVKQAPSNQSVAVKYVAGPFSAAAVTETKVTDGGDSYSAVAASYDFTVIKVMASYADGGKGQKGTQVGFVAPVGGVNFGIIYAKNSDTNTSGTEVFVNKEIFKGTYAYFDYGNVDKPQSLNAYAAGVIFTF